MSLVQFRPEAPPADLAHLVERNLAKVEVAGSIPVIRSKNMGTKNVPIIIRRHGQAVRQRSATPLSPVRFRVAPPKRKALHTQCFSFWTCYARIEPRSVAAGGRIRSAFAARRSTSSLVRRRASEYSRKARNSGNSLKAPLAFHPKVCYNKIRKALEIRVASFTTDRTRARGN